MMQNLVIKYEELSEFFKIFSNETRLAIIEELSEGSRSVKSLSEKVGVSQPNLSHQLKYLRYLDVVEAERNGQSIFYSLTDRFYYDIYQAARKHIAQTSN